MDNLELFTGEASGLEGRVYARLPRPDASDWRLTGQIRGPNCAFAATLSAVVKLRPLDGEGTLLAEAILPDPCFWTPELPFLYDARIELRRGGELVEAVERPLAIRPLGPRGGSLFYAGRRWVLRGVARSTCSERAVSDWREAGAAMLVEEPDDALAEAASLLGVLLVVPTREMVAERVTVELKRLARFPAVAIVVVDARAKLPQEVRRAGPNLLLAAHCRGDSLLPVDAVDWAHLVLCEADAASIAVCATGCSLPVVAFRSAGSAKSVAAARAACDRLQRDLASQADLAGYIV